MSVYGWLWILLGWIPALYLVRLMIKDVISGSDFGIPASEPDAFDYTMAFLMFFMLWFLAPLIAPFIILYHPARYIINGLGAKLFGPFKDNYTERIDL